MYRDEFCKISNELWSNWIRFLKIFILSIINLFLFFSFLGGSNAERTVLDLDYKRSLSKFQIEKYSYMFTSFFDDANSDGLLQREDVDSFLERFRVYSKIDKTNEK